MDKLFIVADSQSVKFVFEEILDGFYVVICCFLDVLNGLGIFWRKVLVERTQVFKERVLKGFELWNGVGTKRNKVLNLDLHTVFDECLF